MLFNLPAGDWAAGERGIAVLPDRIDEFREGVETAIDLCEGAGLRPGQLPGRHRAGGRGRRRCCEDVFVENLKFAAERLEKAGIKLLIEPINTRDIPGFFLNTSKQALAIIDRVGSNNLYFQYDIYHMQVMEGDLARTIEANLDRIAHIQLADNPGRHEPGTGEINYPFLFEHLDRIGYAGWVGANTSRRPAPRPGSAGSRR